MRFLISILMVFAFAGSAMGQEFQVPDYHFKGAASHRQHDKQMKQCLDYLIASPAADWQQPQHKEAVKYLVRWQKDHPDFDIQYKHYIIKIGEDNPELLTLFMVGWAQHYLREGSASNNREAHRAALNTVLDYYQKNQNTLEPNQALEELLQAEENGQMDQYLSKVLGS